MIIYRCGAKPNFCLFYTSKMPALLTLMLMLMLLTSTIGSSYNPSTIVGSNLSDSTRTPAPHFTATRIVNILNNATTGNQSSMRIQALLHTHTLSNQTTSTDSKTVLIKPSPFEAGSSYHPIVTVYIYRYTTLTQEASQSSSSSTSLTTTTTTAAPTVQAYTENNATVADTSNEPRGVVVVKSTVTTVSDIAEICLRLVSTLLAVYHIKMTMKLLG